MKNSKNVELLQNAEAVEEINRYKWVESEKLGRDIGFDEAAKDWLKKHSDQWLAHNTPPPKKAKKSAKRV